VTWETTSGLFEGPATVVDSYFGYNPEYMGGEVLLLMWDLHPDDPDYEDRREQFGIGKNWERSKDGKSVKHESGRDKGFSKQSHYGRIIEWAKTIKLADEIEQENGDPNDATIWIGRRFRFEQVPSNPMATTDEQKAKTKAMPVEYLGRAEGKKGSKGSNEPATSSTASNGQVDVKALRRELIELADGFEGTADEFRDKALRKVEGTDLEETILDGSFYAKYGS
jgi:hypothetical protein